MAEQPEFPDRDFRPDPTKVTSHRGGIFNPWINIPVSILFTLGCGALTVWFAALLMDTLDAPAYEDQGLDIVGAAIGTVAMALVTIALVAVTVFVIRWWHRVGLDWLQKHRTGDRSDDRDTGDPAPEHRDPGPPSGQ